MQAQSSVVDELRGAPQLQIFLIGCNGELVATFIFRVPAVASDLMEVHLVGLGEFVKPAPKIFILHLCPTIAVSTLPAVAFPFSDPLA